MTHLRQKGMDPQFFKGAPEKSKLIFLPIQQFFTFRSCYPTLLHLPTLVVDTFTSS